MGYPKNVSFFAPKRFKFTVFDQNLVKKWSYYPGVVASKSGRGYPPRRVVSVIRAILVLPCPPLGESERVREWERVGESERE